MLFNYVRDLNKRASESKSEICRRLRSKIIVDDFQNEILIKEVKIVILSWVCRQKNGVGQI